MYADELPLDWGAAETLAYATILTDGYDVRLTGQDTARGTFFHRHSVLHDQATGKTDTPLARVAGRQGAVPRDRFDALGRGGARLRVRLLDDGPVDARDLGRPVRRFRERRAGHHRPVHHLGRSQVGPHVRHHAVPAARLRGSGAGTQLGTPRAVSPAFRGDEPPGLRAVDAGPDVPHAAPADAARAAEAARRDDAEEPPAPQALGVHDVGPHRRPV